MILLLLGEGCSTFKSDEAEFIEKERYRVGQTALNGNQIAKWVVIESMVVLSTGATAGAPHLPRNQKKMGVIAFGRRLRKSRVFSPNLGKRGRFCSGRKS